MSQGYRPSIRRLQEDFAARLARKRMRERIAANRKEPLVKPDLDLSNSEPWLANPDSVEDFLEISRRIMTSKERWLSRFNPSSTN